MSELEFMLVMLTLASPFAVVSGVLIMDLYNEYKSGSSFKEMADEITWLSFSMSFIVLITICIILV